MGKIEKIFLKINLKCQKILKKIKKNRMIIKEIFLKNKKLHFSKFQKNENEKF